LCYKQNNEEDYKVIVGVPRESYPGERRVGLVPMVVPSLVKAGFGVVVETGAGVEAGYRDAHYIEKGAKILPDRAAVFSAADVVVQVLCYGSNDVSGAWISYAFNWRKQTTADLFDLLDQLTPKIQESTRALEEEAEKRAVARRLMTHPGVGVLTALAFELVIGTPDRFHCGKQIASYEGLVPSEESSSDRQEWKFG
jgi:Alanine dehydrogenase/PNT, N-terminal domain/Transposase IS116/IS110/IS902 family